MSVRDRRKHAFNIVNCYLKDRADIYKSIDYCDFTIKKVNSNKSVSVRTNNTGSSTLLMHHLGSRNNECLCIGIVELIYLEVFITVKKFFFLQ